MPDFSKIEMLDLSLDEARINPRRVENKDLSGSIDMLTGVFIKGEDSIKNNGRLIDALGNDTPVQNTQNIDRDGISVNDLKTNITRYTEPRRPAVITGETKENDNGSSEIKDLLSDIKKIVSSDAKKKDTPVADNKIPGSDVSDLLKSFISKIPQPSESKNKTGDVIFNTDTFNNDNRSSTASMQKNTLEKISKLRIIEKSTKGESEKSNPVLNNTQEPARSKPPMIGPEVLNSIATKESNKLHVSTETGGIKQASPVSIISGIDSPSENTYGGNITENVSNESLSSILNSTGTTISNSITPQTVENYNQLTAKSESSLVPTYTAGLEKIIQKKGNPDQLSSVSVRNESQKISSRIPELRSETVKISRAPLAPIQTPKKEEAPITEVYNKEEAPNDSNSPIKPAIDQPVNNKSKDAGIQPETQTDMSEVTGLLRQLIKIMQGPLIVTDSKNKF